MFSDEATPFSMADRDIRGILILNQQGNIVYANRTSEKLIGIPVSRITGTQAATYWNATAGEQLRRFLARNNQTGSLSGIWKISYDNVKPAEVRVCCEWGVASGNTPPVCILTMNDAGYSNDMKTLHSRIKRNEALSQAILDTAVDAMIIFRESGEILRFNRAAQKMFRYSEDEATGMKVSSLMPLPYSDYYDHSLQEYIRTGKHRETNQSREGQGLRKDGKVFPAEWSLSEIVWEGNRLFFVMIRDLTRRRNLERKLLEISHEERRKVGLEMHDGLGQMLTGIRLLTESLSRKWKEAGHPDTDKIDEIATMVREADEYTRRLSKGMVQVDVEDKGLSVALQHLCVRIENQTGLSCFYKEEGDVNVPDHTMSLHLFRIVQEAVNNAVKHGGSSTIWIRLSATERHISVTVDDDGEGFDPRITIQHGTGLQTMKHRAGILGGVLEIERTDDGLTRVSCLVPCDMKQFT